MPVVRCTATGAAGRRRRGEGVSLTEYRCPTCQKLLFKSDAPTGVVQTPCPRCRSVKMVQVRPPPVRLTAVRA
jgi:phage FluMu protein Com